MPKPSRRTVLKELSGVLAEMVGADVQHVVDDPEDILGDLTAAKVVEYLRSQVVREALG